MVDINSSSLFQSNLSTILHWPLARKIELLSSFSQCSTPLCLCAGWIKPNESTINDLTTNDDTTITRKPLLCCSCQHSYDVHYNEKTKTKYWSSESTLEQVDSALQTLLDADLLIRFATSSSLSDQHDLSTNRTLLFVAQTLQSTITTMSIHLTRRDLINTNMINLLGMCPFEQPCIRDAVINFICSTTPTVASTATNDNQQLHIIFDAGKQFLHLLNTWKMPSHVAHQLWLQQQSSTQTTNIRKVKAEKNLLDRELRVHVFLGPDPRKIEILGPARPGPEKNEKNGSEHDPGPIEFRTEPSRVQTQVRSSSDPSPVGSRPGPDPT
jgi:hypothetical protein